ncbi:MAG: GNAT family N-acetyltransferase [bacterium]|nr:GNAT family N-acetyltransferase [bacterium]
MNAAFNILACNWKHYALLADIGAVTFYETFSPHNEKADMVAYIEKTYNLKQVEDNLKEAHIHYFVCYNEKQDVGYIKLIENVVVDELSGHIMELEKIYVRQFAHGTKAASLLMQEAIDLARTNGANYLYLGVWQENERALAFYKKFGFEVFSTRSFQLGKRLCEDYLLKLDIRL